MNQTDQVITFIEKLGTLGGPFAMRIWESAVQREYVLGVAAHVVLAIGIVCIAAMVAYVIFSDPGTRRLNFDAENSLAICAVIFGVITLFLGIGLGACNLSRLYTPEVYAFQSLIHSF